MNGNRSTRRSGKSYSDRLWLKVAGLSVISFVLALIAFLAYGMLNSFSESSAPGAESNSVTAIVIDPKIENDLTQVLASEAEPAPNRVNDPFMDRGGLSNTVTASTAAASQQPSVAATKSPLSGTVTGRGSTAGSVITPSNNSALQDVASAVATRARHESWEKGEGQYQNRRPESEVFAINDLIPIGYSSGGTGVDELMLYSQALCKTISVSVGAHFLNAWLYSFNQDEVVFNVNNVILRKSFRRPDGCAVDDKATTASPAGLAVVKGAADE